MSTAAQRPITLITGGTRGIGAATARLLAAAGHDLALGYRSDEAAASALAEELSAHGGRVVLAPGDVGDPEQVTGIFELVDAELGPITGLVNNAAIVAPVTGVEGISVERLRRMFATNVYAVVWCVQQAVRRMSTDHGGRGGAIVNVSSQSAQHGAPGVYVDYGATKGAVDALTAGLGAELAPQGIRVNGVRPGLIDTEIHHVSGTYETFQRAAGSIPIGRLGTADDVAKAIVWLLSEEAGYLAGATVDVTGGR